MNEKDWTAYLNVPEASSGPWFSKYLYIFTLFEPEDLLRIPFKLLRESRIDEMVHDPVPQGTVPGFVSSFFVLKFTNDFSSLKL